METSPWRRFPSCVSSPNIFCVNWCRTPTNNCYFYCYCLCHLRRTIHRVSLQKISIFYKNVCTQFCRRGSLLSTAIFVYAATSPINGYFGGSLYARMGGKLWIRQMLVASFMLPAFVCGTAFCINFIAIYYHASRAIPFGTMVCIQLFIGFIFIA